MTPHITASFIHSHAIKYGGFMDYMYINKFIDPSSPGGQGNWLNLPHDIIPNTDNWHNSISLKINRNHDSYWNATGILFASEVNTPNELAKQYNYRWLASCAAARESVGKVFIIYDEQIIVFQGDDFNVPAPSTENQELSWWQLCRHCRHYMLSLWQLAVLPLSVKLALWPLVVLLNQLILKISQRRRFHPEHVICICGDRFGRGTYISNPSGLWCYPGDSDSFGSQLNLFPP